MTLVHVVLARSLKTATEKINSKYPYKITIFKKQKGIFVKNLLKPLFLWLILTHILQGCQGNKHKKPLYNKGFLCLTRVKIML